MKLLMRWIQLSDIHFQTKNNTFNTLQLKTKLPEYLKNKIEGPIQALIITGDYRFAPEGEENPTKVVEYILNLAQSIGISAEMIVTTPGKENCLPLLVTVTYLDVVCCHHQLKIWKKLF